MKIKKIEIDITDPRRFGDVALLVDKPEFLKQLYKLREKWKIEKLFEPSEYKIFQSYILDMHPEENMWEELKKDIKDLRIRFQRTPNFDKVILYALAFTKVPEDSYRTCYLKTFSNLNSSEDSYDVEYAIVITPYTTQSELTWELEDFKKRMKKSIKNYIKGPHIIQDESLIDYEFNVKYKPIFRKSLMIIRARECYWLLRNNVYKNESITKLLDYETVRQLWYEKCPKKENHISEEEEKECIYCVFDNKIIGDNIDAYTNLLKESMDY